MTTLATHFSPMGGTTAKQSTNGGLYGAALPQKDTNASRSSLNQTETCFQHCPSGASAPDGFWNTNIARAAMAFVRKNHPEFFKSQSSRELAAIIVLEMGDELAKHSPVERAGMIAGIMALMYQMGTAALKTIRDPQGRDMARILVDNYRAGL